MASKRLFAPGCAALLLAACGTGTDSGGPENAAGANRSALTGYSNVVLDWGAHADAASVMAGESRLVKLFTITMVHLAMYDAVIAIEGGFEPYAIAIAAPAGASRDAAAASAGHRVLTSLFPAQRSALDTKLAASLSANPDAESAKLDGIAVGVQAGDKILELRKNDGRFRAVTYVPGNGPGVYQLTPPESPLPVVSPQLATTTPFLMESPSQFRGPPPYALTTPEYAADFNEVKLVGSRNSTVRTQEQTDKAIFWADGSNVTFTEAPRLYAIDQQLGVADSARLLAMTQTAMVDALIAIWDMKYTYNFWRPITAIRAADTDGNPDTEVDTTWVPLLATPNHPEYASGHMGVSTAVGHTMANFVGTKRFTYRVRSILAAKTRVFNNIDDMIKEIADARVWAGIHYRTSDMEGKVVGQKVAHWLSSHYFLPAGPRGRSNAP